MTKRTLRERIDSYRHSDSEALETAEYSLMAVLEMIVDQQQDATELPPDTIAQLASIAKDLAKVATARANIRNQSALTVAEVKLLEVTMHKVIELVPPESRPKAISMLKALKSGKDTGNRNNTDAGDVVDGEYTVTQG